ncbi:MAG: sensor histidine kinase [Alphaproteobacteria bacterium]
MSIDKLETKILDTVERIANIGHWQYDIANNTLFWSDEVYRIHGLNFDDYTPSVEAAIDAYLPEDQAHVEALLQQSIEKAESFDFQKRIRRPDGEVRFIHAQGECELDFDGSVTSIFGTIQDLTELRTQEELYELAALSSDAAIWDWDIREDTLNWTGNSGEILGYTNPKDLPKTTDRFFSTLVHPDDHERLKKAFATHFKNRKPFSINIRLSSDKQNYRWFASRAQAQWNQNERAIRMCGSLYDITPLKETQEKLKRSNDDLSQFATIAAHDLKAPLRAISGFLEILQLKYYNDLDEQAHEYIEYSVRGAEDMEKLIDNLLEYSGINAEGLKHNEIDIDDLLDRIINTIPNKSKNKHITIHRTPMPTIKCDEHKIKRVFHNLIENGIKYCDAAAPTIHIKHEETEKNWLFSVHDNGIGIDPDKHNEIFLMFRRLHTKQDYSGTGIGLAICKRIVELHGGAIWLSSKPGKGSTFFFTVPKG